MGIFPLSWRLLTHQGHSVVHNVYVFVLPNQHLEMACRNNSITYYGSLQLNQVKH